MIWSAIFISMGGFIFGDFVISHLYKEKYNLAPGIFKIHIWTTLTVFYGTAWSMWMIVEKKQKYIIYSQLISMCIGLMLNLKLIPLYGITGAAYALLISQLVNLVIIVSIYKPAVSWEQFLRALNIKNLFDILKYLRNSGNRA